MVWNTVKLVSHILTQKYCFFSVENLKEEFWEKEIYKIRKILEQLVDNGNIKPIGIKRGIYQLTHRNPNWYDFARLGILIGGKWTILALNSCSVYEWKYENQTRVLHFFSEKRILNTYFGWYYFRFYQIKDCWLPDYIKWFGNLYSAEKGYLDEISLFIKRGQDYRKFCSKKYYLGNFSEKELQRLLEKWNYSKKVLEVVKRDFWDEFKI